MLWPLGKLEGEQTSEEAWNRYAGFVRIGYDAAKEAFSDINVIVHIDNAYMYRDWFWTNLAEHGGKWDMIGLSHYPMMFEWCQKPWMEMNQLARKTAIPFSQLSSLLFDMEMKDLVCSAPGNTYFLPGH